MLPFELCRAACRSNPHKRHGLGCTSKHFKWEEAPAHLYCLSSPISKTSGLTLLQPNPPGSGNPQAESKAPCPGLEQWEHLLGGQLAMEGSVGLRMDTGARLGYRALAHRLGAGACMDHRDHRSHQGGSGQGVLCLGLFWGWGGCWTLRATLPSV